MSQSALLVLNQLVDNVRKLEFKFLIIFFYFKLFQSDMDLHVDCENECTELYVTCAKKCDYYDDPCRSECARLNRSCVEGEAASVN